MAEENTLGDSQLSESKLGKVSETPGAFPADRERPRDRFEDWVKGAFDTSEGSNFDALLNTLASEFETELTVRQNIWLQQYVDHASAAQLDKIGALFQLDRKRGERDAHYRERIKLQIPKLTGGARIDEILNLSAHVLDCNPTDLELAENPDVEPARFDLFVNDQIVDKADITLGEFENLLQDIKAAGVRAVVRAGPQFTYRSEYEYEQGINDESRGYGGLESNVGGGYAGLIGQNTTTAPVPGTRQGTVNDPAGFGMDGFGDDDFGS